MSWIVLTHRARRRLCFHKAGVRWFVRCRCGRHAVVHLSRSVLGQKPTSRWYCRRHAPADLPSEVRRRYVERG